jgi:hypothetical protein
MIGIWVPSEQEIQELCCEVNYVVSFLLGSGNLYPGLQDTVVGTCIDPNKLPSVTSEHNLEASGTQKCVFPVMFLAAGNSFYSFQILTS